MCSGRARDLVVARHICHKIGHRAAHRTELEGPAGVLLELDLIKACALDRAFDGVDRSVEAALIDLKGGLLGLADLLDDLFVAGSEVGVVVGLLLEDGTDLVVLTRVGGGISEDGELGDVGIVFWVESFELWMQAS